MTTDLAKMSDHAATIETVGAWQPRTFADAFGLAQMIAASNLCPDTLRRKPGDVMLLVMGGAEYGLSAFKAIQTMHVIKGRVCMSADLIAGLVQSHPACEYFRMVESTAESCTYETKRKGSPKPERLTYTFEEAKKAGLTGKTNWQENRADMLRARVKTKLSRASWPDVVAGLYSPEELIDSEPEKVKTTAEDSLLADLEASVAAGAEAAKLAVEPIDGADLLETPEPELSDDGEPIPPLGEPGDLFS